MFQLKFSQIKNTHIYTCKKKKQSCWIRLLFGFVLDELIISSTSSYAFLFVLSFYYGLTFKLFKFHEFHLQILFYSKACQCGIKGSIYLESQAFRSACGNSVPSLSCMTFCGRVRTVKKDDSQLLLDPTSYYKFSYFVCYQCSFGLTNMKNTNTYNTEGLIFCTLY